MMTKGELIEKIEDILALRYQYDSADEVLDTIEEVIGEYYND